MYLYIAAPLSPYSWSGKLPTISVAFLGNAWTTVWHRLDSAKEDEHTVVEETHETHLTERSYGVHQKHHA